jgi:hypothetical protein
LGTQDSTTPVRVPSSPREAPSPSSLARSRGARWLHTPKDAPYQFGLIWLPPQTSPFGAKGTYLNVDKPWFYEYHWYGLQLLTGNAYVLAGIAVLFVMLIVALVLPVPPIAPRGTGSDTTVVMTKMRN